MRPQPGAAPATRVTVDGARGVPEAPESAPGQKPTDSVRRHKGAITVIFLLLVAAASVFAPLSPVQRLAYDEADYAYAASKGLLVNYLDTGAISAASFLAKGLESVNGANWSALSQYIRSTDDVTFYRHYHGPLYFYSLSLAERYLGTHESSLRLISFAFLLFCAVVLFVGSLVTLPKSAGLAGCLAAFFLLVSPTNLATAMWLGPHALYAATAMVALFLMAKMIQSNRTFYLYASMVAVAVCFAVIEYALLLLVTLITVVLIYRKPLFADCSVKQMLLLFVRCAALFVVTIAVIWPAGIFKVTVVKDYLFFLYFTTVRSASAYGTQSLAHVWWLRVLRSPLEFTCVLAFVAAFVATVARKRAAAVLLPFIIYASLVAMSTLRNHSESPLYISSLFPPLFFVGSVLLAGTIENRRRTAHGLVAVVIAAFAINGYLYAYLPLSQVRPDPIANGIVEVLNRAGVRKGKVLVPRDSLPTAHFYFPSLEYVPYADAVSFSELSREIAASGADGLVIVGTEVHELQGTLSQKQAAAVVHGGTGVDIAYVALR